MFKVSLAVVLAKAISDASFEGDAASLLSFRKNVDRSHARKDHRYSQANTNVKCRFNHADRLFRTTPGSKQACYEQCRDAEGCNFFSFGESSDSTFPFPGVCMGCKGDMYDSYVDETDRFEPHKGFNLYEMTRTYTSRKRHHMTSNKISVNSWGNNRVLTMWASCVGASDKAWAAADANAKKPKAKADLTLTKPFCFKKMKIKYVSGHLSCRNADTGRSFFGCDADCLGLHLAKKVGAGSHDYDFIFPRDDRVDQTEREWNLANIKGFNRMDKAHAPWYKLDGYNPRSEKLIFRKPGVEYNLDAGEYRLLYNEDLTNGTEADNSGVACFHTSFFLCDGEDETQFLDNDAVTVKDFEIKQQA